MKGLINMKDTKKNEREEYLYHNTKLLLEKYRDVVWSIEASVAQVNTNFEIEFECRIDEFLDMCYAAGADLTGTNLEEQMRTVERNRKMLKIIEKSLDIIHQRHKFGELYYQIIYLTYMSPEPFENVNAVIEELCDLGFAMSAKTYFRKKKAAVTCLSTVLWGFATRECSNIMTEILGDGER